MATVSDIIEGASVSLSLNGPTATRIFRIEGLTGTAQAKLFNALSETDIPDFGDAHPEISGIFASSITAEPVENQNNVAQVTVVYTAPEYGDSITPDVGDQGLIQLGATVASGKTQVDNSGNQITVSLTGHPDQTGDVDIQIPEAVITFERRESSSPLADATTYAGTVNASSIGGFDARTLFCLGIEGQTNDNGLTWNVTYRFQYNPNTWDVDVFYEDPETGRIHNDVDLSAPDGVTTVQVYPTTNFSTLNLNW